MSSIEISDVCKRFGETEVLRGVGLTVQDGSITAVLGPSGSGKTTLLRLIAGFETLDEGSIAIGERVVDDSRRALSAQNRGVGYVPQDGALFPHL
ncbi:MAG TPA: ATP-binding cassette domain-containing protein, partial [Solirubrobacteraceae bacterium]|nr:ATP-binding cassette domain-containing protein [Solirubrobacteraceae bacterium]